MIPVFKPSYDWQETRAVEKVLQSGWSGLGPRVEEFEEKFAASVMARYAVATNSCTSALQLGLIVKGMCGRSKFNGVEWLPHEIIVPTITFASTAHVVTHVGARVLFCDVYADTLTINEEEAQFHNDTAHGIIPVVYGGAPLEISGKLVDAYEGNVLYDCAHACGSTFVAADKTCAWSFHAVKNLACGDGGMLTTNNPDHWERAKHLRWLGINKSTHERSTGDHYSYDYDIEELGFKCHMNDITAAIGLEQLRKLKFMQEQRHNIAWRYLINLENTELILPDYRGDHSWHLYVIRTPNRDSLMDYLASFGIATSVHYKPLHLYKCYGKQKPLPVAERVWQELLTLPMYPSLKLSEVDTICHHIKDWLRLNSKSSPSAETASSGSATCETVVDTTSGPPTK